MALQNSDLPKLVELLNLIDIRVKQRRRTAAEWAASDEVLLEGEVGLVTDAVPLPVTKTGDGVSHFSTLPVDDLQFAAATGTDTITAIFTPAPVLYDGLLLQVRAAGANTGAATFNPNGLGALALRKNGGTALSAGDIAVSGHELLLRYVAGSPGHYELLNPVATSGGGGGGSGSGSGNPLTPYIPATVVQDAASTNSNSSTKSVTLSRAPWPGNVLILCMSIATTTTISSISQTGVTWTQVAGNSGLNPTVAIWKGVVGSSPGSTITVTIGTSGFNSFWVGEFNGVAGTLGVHSESTSAAAAYDTGTIVPASYSLIVSVMGTTNGSTPFLATSNNEFNSGVRVVTPALSVLSGSGSALGTLNVSAYYSGDSTGVRYGNVSGNVASVIAAIT